MLASYVGLPAHPPTGWLSEIRRALGMTTSDIAGKLGVAQSTVTRLEESEAAGTIALNSLRRYADALDCDVLYAVVPRAGSLEAQLQARARAAALRIVRGVTHTMALESQAPEPEHIRRQVDDLADELVRTLGRELWKAPD